MSCNDVNNGRYTLYILICSIDRGIKRHMHAVGVSVVAETKSGIVVPCV